LSELPINQRISYLILLGIAAKLLIDTSIQIFNPFLTMIAAGIGISAITLGGLVALRGLTGLFAPAIGAIADKVGHKLILQLSLFMSGTGMILAGFSRSPVLFAAAIIITGIGQAGFAPNLHAYLSTKLSYDKRARGIGIVEYSWALAGIFGLFTTGYLIEKFSWRSPFIIIGSLLILASIIYFSLAPEKIDRHNTNSIKKISSGDRSLLKRLFQFFHLGKNARSAWGTIIVQGLNMFAIMHVMIIHGGWLGREYNLSPSQLGTVALVFGFSDLAASIFVSIAADRIGKKKSVAIGVAGMTIGFALMPVLNIGLYAAVLGIMLPRISFEVATVSNLALLTEQVPEQRGKVMSLSTTFGLIGITAASALGPVSYYSRGVTGLAIISFAVSLLSFILVIFVIKDKAHIKKF